jgi:hypothetical protein
MSGHGTQEGVRVELYARSSLPSVAQRRRETVERRLEDLVGAGHVGALETETWDKKVPLDEPTFERARFEEFEEWASEVGVSLDPFFDTRDCYSMETGERGDRLVLPALCVAIYRNETLQTVYPHSTPQGSRTVLDCLDAIETVETDPDPDDFGSPPSEERERDTEVIEAAE